MANASVLPFGGAQFSEVAYGVGINLISNMYTAERMEAFTRYLLYPTVVKIVEGLATRGVVRSSGPGTGQSFSCVCLGLEHKQLQVNRRFV